MRIIEKYDMLLDMLIPEDAEQAERHMKNITDGTSEKASLALQKMSGEIGEDEFNARYSTNHYKIVEAIKWLNDMAAAMKTPALYEGNYNDEESIRDFCNDLTNELIGDLGSFIDSVLKDIDWEE